MGIWRFKLHQMSLRFSPLLLSLIWALNLSAQTAGIPTDSLIAFYPLQDASAQNAASDLLQGVLHGSPEPTADRFGNPMGAMRFESGDYITVPGSNGSVFLPFSVSLWYSPDPDDAYSGTLKPLFKKYSPAYWRGVQVATTYRDGQQTVIPWYLRGISNRVIGDYGLPPFMWQNTSQPSDSSWYHVVFTVDSLGGKIYVNGELMDAQPWDGQFGVATSYHSWQLAGTYETADTVGYIGALDDVAVWNKTLSSGEVANMYNFDGETYAGCTNTEACNYDAFAVLDNGSCLMPGAWCNDGNEDTIGDVLTDDCLCVGQAPVDTSGTGACQGENVLNYLGRDYKLVEIGNQCWFSENLASGQYANGDTIPYGTSGSTWPSISQPKWGVLGDSLELAEEYGYLYNHVAASDERNICPAGWRVPSVTDFDAAVALFGTNNAAYRSPGTLETGTGLWQEVVGSGNNASGFNGKPFGMRTYQGDDVETGIVTSFWASEAPIPQGGIRWILGYSAGYPFQNFWHLRSRGSYVRCVQGPLPGCTNDGACNYNSEAEEDNGSCIFAEEQGWCDCDENVLDDCGVCGGDNSSCTGCTNPEACNYDPEATLDDESCQLLVVETTAFCIMEEGALATMLTWDADTSAVEAASDSLMAWTAFWSNGASGDSALYAYGEFQGSLVLMNEGDTLCATSFEFGVGEGCNDSEACNFNGADACDIDCIYPAVGEDCLGGEGLCGEGTYWDAASQSCLVAVPGDFDYDGCINVNDLLGTLAVYNLCFDLSGIGFDCGLEKVNYQGHQYATVQIGEDCWFAENLRATAFLNGDSIPTGLSGPDWSGATSPAVAVYGDGDGLTGNCCPGDGPDSDDEAYNLEVYGRLYNGWAKNDPRGLCPTGWHISDVSDWDDLVSHFGGYSLAGNALKGQDALFVNWQPEDVEHFGALPAGYRDQAAGLYYYRGADAGFWTAQGSQHRRIYGGAQMLANNVSLQDGYSIRCVKD